MLVKRKPKTIRTAVQAFVIRLAIEDARIDGAMLKGSLEDSENRPRWNKAHALWHINGASLTWEQNLYRKAYIRAYKSAVGSV